MWAVWAVLRGMANVALTLAFFYLVGWWIFVGYMDRLRSIEDPLYATELFGSFMPVSDVLASRKWHARDSEPWDCTYAIVTLAGEQPHNPPTRERDNALGWMYTYGGNWQASPAAPLGENHRDALDFCSKYWSPELLDTLKTALYSSGAWFARDRVGETLFLYAPKQRLAARIRFGD